MNLKKIVFVCTAHAAIVMLIYVAAGGDFSAGPLSGFAAFFAAIPTLAALLHVNAIDD